MKPRCSIPFAWCRRAITCCRGRPWRGCIILSSALAALLAASWFALEWTDEGSETFPGGTVLRDGAGNVLRVTLGPGDVDCRPSYEADPNDWIVKALVAVEDDTFWTHRGVRPLSILRAAFQNVFYRRRISGASTISMQTVRLIRPHPKTYWWKFREAVMALKMERARDKRWILSQYLNRVPYGSNLVGIEAASAGWFGKSARELGIGEAALLAGMVQSPSRFRPDRALDKALRRRDYVLERMLVTGVITREQMEGAKSVRPAVCRAPRPFSHPHFCDWVLGRLDADPVARRRSGDFRTTLDADVQAIVHGAIGAAAEEGGYSVSAVVMKVDTGAVVALDCSGDYFDPKSGQVNTALAPRPAGSALKPFLTALAMDLGCATPGERLRDAPMAFKGYRPANFDAAYRGRVSVRDALILSLNIPFVQLLGRVGIGRFGANLRELGFAHLKMPDEAFGLGMAIGNVEVTLVELVTAYAVLARGGVFRPAAALREEADAAETKESRRIYSAGASYLVSDMLSGEERGAAALGHVAQVRASRFAWKTGTSSAYRDAWTVVWNPDCVVGVWCGHKSGGFGDKTLVGARAAAPVAWTIARALYPRDDGPWFARPDEVTTRTVCAETGLPSNPRCPATERDAALRGRSSSALCRAHGFGNAPPASPPAILKPENGARFVIVPGMAQQKIVCQAGGVRENERLWWFVDGTLRGVTQGNQPFVTDMTVGVHEIVCSTAEGETASVALTVALSQI